jgi:hypothetical protein
MSDFNEAYSQTKKLPLQPILPKPSCTPPACFIGSYAPVTPAGQTGPFWVNSYFLRPERKSELAGPVPVRSANVA